MKNLTKKEAQTKHKDLIKENGEMILTSDGQAFYNDEKGKNFAYSHSSNTKCKVFMPDAKETEGEDVDVWTTGVENITKQKRDVLDAKAAELGIDSEGMKSKALVAEAIVEKMAEIAE